MTEQSFQALLGRFPNLGVKGAWLGGKDCPVDPALSPILDAAVATYDPDLRAAIEAWVANNENLMPLLAARNSTAKAAALADCVQRHTDKCIRAGCAPAEAAKTGADYGHLVERHANRLMAGVAAPLFPGDEVILHRGMAILLSEFDRDWVPGATICRPLPLACTLSPDYAPLHFAWKRHGLVRAKFPNDPIASIILRIKIEPGPASPLIWAGFVRKGQAELDYRWQQEIIAPPEFRLTVIGRGLYPGASGNLYLVEALGSFA